METILRQFGCCVKFINFLHLQDVFESVCYVKIFVGNVLTSHVRFVSGFEGRNSKI